MSPPHKLPASEDEVILESLPDIAAGVELPKGEVELPKGEPVPPQHEDEMNEWERAGVRPPQRFR